MYFLPRPFLALILQAATTANGSGWRVIVCTHRWVVLSAAHAYAYIRAHACTHMMSNPSHHCTHTRLQPSCDTSHPPTHPHTKAVHHCATLCIHPWGVVTFPWFELGTSFVGCHLRKPDGVGYGSLFFNRSALVVRRRAPPCSAMLLGSPCSATLPSPK
jgi:hypothetical protein